MSRFAFRLAIAALAASLSAAAAAGSAEVSFSDPRKFTDIGPYGDQRQATANCDEIAAHLKKLAETRLPADETLQIEVLDVDLAGRLQPWRHHEFDVRVMHPVTWPSIRLKYRLTRNGEALASGQEVVSDMDYLERINGYPSSDSLRYEKRMLDDWFTHRIVEHQRQPR